MKQIIYIDRQTGKQQLEKVYKEKYINFFYGDRWYNHFFHHFILPFFTKWHLFSKFYGYLQKRPSSVKKILPFIEEYEVDSNEFLDPISSYRSFNDFFIRKLKSSARPIDNSHQAIIPADGRYYFYENITTCSGFIVKGKKFDIGNLLNNSQLAEEYAGGSMVIARLCPSDYHRFHFPCDCVPGATQLINGPLFSVNPLAVKKNIEILAENKRMICKLSTVHFGEVIYIEIGATNVGSIQETYTPDIPYAKGTEKGYFEFGGSALILLFKKNTIAFCSDLLNATEQGLEMRCLLDQPMGQITN